MMARRAFEILVIMAFAASLAMIIEGIKFLL